MTLLFILITVGASALAGIIGGLLGALSVKRWGGKAVVGALVVGPLVLIGLVVITVLAEATV